jgi:hypothetical protein
MPSMIPVGDAQEESSKMLKCHPFPSLGRMNAKIETKAHTAKFSLLYPDFLCRPPNTPGSVPMTKSIRYFGPAKTVKL